jgi:RNA polymerase sigma factor (sigma-70 family)
VFFCFSGRIVAVSVLDCRGYLVLSLADNWTAASFGKSEGRMTDWQPEQIEAFYRNHSRELWALFYSMCNDPERAYDAVQESFAKLYDYRGQPVRDLKAWLLRVGQNWLRDAARRKSNSVHLLPGLDDHSSSTLTADELLQLKERQQQIRQALQMLNEDDRRVLVMKYSMDWSSAQMATVMDSTAAAVDMRLSRARRRLAEILTEQGFTND